MSKIRIVEPEEAQGSAKRLMEQLVLPPNIVSVMANSELAVRSFLLLSDLAEKFALPRRWRKMVSLAVSQFNDCPYCLALHTHQALEENLLNSEECLNARQLKGSAPRDVSFMNFIREILENRGSVSDEGLAVARKLGLDDEQLVEAVSWVAMIHMANYVANLAQLENDFPDAPPLS